MDNPWTALPAKPPYVLPSDANIINGRPDIRLDLLPMPYMGHPDRAALYVLTLNPGVSQGDEALLQNPYFVDQNRRSLTFESTYPFCQFDPALAGTPGHVYWAQCLGQLGVALGEDFLRERVMCVEYFPYHSWRFHRFPQRLPSQSFSFDLVRQAVAQRKPIVLLRGRKLWLSSVPELASSAYYELKSINSTVSTRNMAEGVFQALVDTCRRATKGVA